VPCHFEIGQFAGGEIYTICHLAPEEGIDFYPTHWDAVSIHGATSQGLAINSHLDLTYVDSNHTYYRDGGRYDVTLLCGCNAIDLRTVSSDPPVFVRYQLTNAVFRGNPRNLSFRLRNSTRTFEVWFCPATDYLEKVDRFKIVRATQVTANLDIQIPAGSEIAEIDTIISDVCTVLSVGLGTKVNWISRNLLGTDGAVNGQYLAANITRPYAPMGPVSLRFRDDGTTTRFVETAYHAYLDHPLRPQLAAFLDAYVDAKSEIDYLEFRGVKLAVALELLKALLKSESASTPFIVAGVFNAIKQELRFPIEKILESHKELSPDQRTRILRNALSRPGKSFREQLRDLFSDMNFGLHDKEIGMFIDSRNSLIHQGRFYTASLNANERNRDSAFTSVSDEFFFMMNLLDRVTLTLLGYNGQYIDWRIPEESRERLVDDNHWPHPLPLSAEKTGSSTDAQ
jgi:hypothetical protein